MCIALYFTAKLILLKKIKDALSKSLYKIAHCMIIEILAISDKIVTSPLNNDDLSIWIAIYIDLNHFSS